jgi:formate dehydrogenase major subunit
MGSNMAENHPVGFQWVAEAKLRGARVFHVDPRFTRTSAFADRHVPIRAGTDIAFLGGIVNHVLTQGREFREYVLAYTNAASLVSEDFRDTEDLDGLFSGFDPETNTYDPASWRFEGHESHDRSADPRSASQEMQGAQGAELPGGAQAEDPTLEHPRCVFQVLKRHFARYTPEMVEQVCGTPRELFLEVAEALCDNSGRERTSAFVYSVGWTHHTKGVQYIRTASILQLLLGNIGRPGGGILALRGHASIQGSTDIPTLFNLLPGYLPMPQSSADADLAEYVERNASPTGWWGHMRAYVVSLLKAYYGAAATADSDFCFGHLPRISGDHSIYPTILAMLDGEVRGFFVLGENPAVGSANSRLHRLAMAKLDWLVVRDLVEVETASFWKDAPEIATGELRTADIATEVFLLPAAAHTEKDGSFTNTQRLIQWHRKAVEPRGDARSDLWFVYHLGRLLRERLAGSTEPRDRPLLDLAWDYPVCGDLAEPDAEAVLAEISGFRADGTPLAGYTEMAEDGSTSCGCWIYCGVRADGVNQADRRRPGAEQDWVAAEWGWAWPANRRILYNRASADPEGRPWSQRKAYVWWDEQAGRWTGYDNPDFSPTMRPDYEPADGGGGGGGKAEQALSGRLPFIMQADGRGWLYAPNGLSDGPLPAHYEPHESPVHNPLYGQQANPTRERYDRRHNRYNPSAGQAGEGAYPFVMATYRIAEHHTAGGMSRFGRRLVELAPEAYCEVSPDLAEARGLEHGGWATIVTARTAIEMRVMVTRRIKSLRVEGRAVHLVGLPYHWGYRGTSEGDAANDLMPIVLDQNVHISEFKAASCDILPGRRPRGPDLPAFVAAHRRRAGLPEGSA